MIVPILAVILLIILMIFHFESLWLPLICVAIAMFIGWMGISYLLVLWQRHIYKGPARR